MRRRVRVGTGVAVLARNSPTAPKPKNQIPGIESRESNPEPSPTPKMPSIETLRRILAESRTIAVVGISEQWHRPSFFVGKYLLAHRYRMVPVNPRYREVLGQICYPSLHEIPFQVDLVDVFRRTEEVLPIAQDAVTIGAKVLWQQLGVTNVEADALARAHCMDAVMDRCVKIEHARLFGGLNWMGVNTGVISARRPQQLPY